MSSNSTSIFSKSRLETFSDGVFAIIVTLLVLEIKVPHIEDYRSTSELFHALLGLAPKFISWVISFFTVCVIWVNHHRLFKVFDSIPHGLFWWNALLLLWASFIPFPTALIGDYPNNTLAVFFYGIILSFMAMSFSFMRIFVIRNSKVLNPLVNLEEFRKGTMYSILFGPGLYLAGAALSWLNTYISFIIYFGIAVYFIFPHSTKD